MKVRKEGYVSKKGQDVLQALSMVEVTFLQQESTIT